MEEARQILLADDEKPVADYLVPVLEHALLAVTVAQDGQTVWVTSLKGDPIRDSRAANLIQCPSRCR